MFSILPELQAPIFVSMALIFRFLVFQNGLLEICRSIKFEKPNIVKSMALKSLFFNCERTFNLTETSALKYDKKFKPNGLVLSTTVYGLSVSRKLIISLRRPKCATLVTTRTNTYETFANRRAKSL